MKKLFVIVGVVLLTVITVVGFTKLPNAQPSGTNTAENNQRTFNSIQQEITIEGVPFYDVRTAEEFATGHFENATNFPLLSIQAGQYPPVEKDSKIYLYCNSGNRSGQAAALLNQAGFTNVVDLGGLTDVQALGGELITN